MARTTFDVSETSVSALRLSPSQFTSRAARRKGVLSADLSFLTSESSA